DLQHGGVIGAGEGSQRVAAPGAWLLRRRQLEALFDGGQVRVITPFGARLPRSLTPRVLRSGRAGRALSRGRGVGLAPEELLLPQAKLGLERGDLFFEQGLTSHGAIEHRLVVCGLAPGLELLGQAWANRARSLRDGGRGAGRQGIRSGVRPGDEAILGGHGARCNRRRAGEPEPRMGLPKLYAMTTVPARPDPNGIGGRESRPRPC